MVARLPHVARDGVQPPEDASSLSLGYGKWTAQLKGRDTMVVFLLALLVCGQLWFSWHVLKRIDQQHTAIMAEMQVQTWLLSRPIADRPQLAMPQALRPRLADKP